LKTLRWRRVARRLEANCSHVEEPSDTHSSEETINQRAANEVLFVEAGVDHTLWDLLKNAAPGSA
jgi:hypothetical protein